MNVDRTISNTICNTISNTDRILITKEIQKNMAKTTPINIISRIEQRLYISANGNPEVYNDITNFKQKIQLVFEKFIEKQNEAIDKTIISRYGPNAITKRKLQTNTIGTKITYYTGYYTDINQTTIIGLRNVVPSNGTHIFKVGDNDEVKIDSIYTTVNNNLLQFGTNCIEQLGGGANIFKTSSFNGNVTFNNNIILNSTYYAKTSGQLGNRINGTYTYSGVADFEINSGIYNLASISLPVGVWSINGQCSYERRTNSSVIEYENNSISELSNTLDGFCKTTNYYYKDGSAGMLEYPTKQITRIFDVQTPTTLYLQLQVVYINVGGQLKPRITSVSTTYTRLYAVRIA
jgi:hypothetical protein